MLSGLSPAPPTYRGIRLSGTLKKARVPRYGIGEWNSRNPSRFQANRPAEKSPHCRSSSFAAASPIGFLSARNRPHLLSRSMRRSEWSAPNECQTHHPGSREAGRRVRSLSRNALPREPGANPGVSTANAGFRAPSVRNTKGSPTAAKGKAPSYDPQCPTAISDKLSHGNRRRRIPLPKKTGVVASKMGPL